MELFSLSERIVNQSSFSRRDHNVSRVHHSHCRNSMSCDVRMQDTKTTRYERHWLGCECRYESGSVIPRGKINMCTYSKNYLSRDEITTWSSMSLRYADITRSWSIGFRYGDHRWIVTLIRGRQGLTLIIPASASLAILAMKNLRTTCGWPFGQRKYRFKRR